MSDNLQGARHSLQSPSPTMSSVPYSDTVISPQSTAPTTPLFDEYERPRSATVQRRPGQHLPFLLNTGLSRMPAEGSPPSVRSGRMRDVRSMESMTEGSHASRPTLSPSFRQPSLFTLAEQNGGATEDVSPRVLRRAASFRSPSKLPCVKTLSMHTDDLKDRLVAMQLRTRNGQIRTQTLGSMSSSNSIAGEAPRSYAQDSPLAPTSTALYLDYKALQLDNPSAHSRPMRTGLRIDSQPGRQTLSLIHISEPTRPY